LFSQLAPGFLIDGAPYTLSGTVYGTLLNQRSAVDAVGAAAAQPPYQAFPKAPVLYVKPRNTLVPSGEPVPFPDDVDELEVGACLGIVIGRTACRIAAGAAFDHIAGYLAVNDISVPHPNYYRPSIRYKARDGFCPLGPVTRRAVVGNPDALAVRTYVDGILVAQANTADSVRGIATLLEDVTDFMTLSPGDVLAIGAAAPAPRVRRGQTVRIEIEGLGALTNRLGMRP
jgi:5-oxopent-3-ene-1,2,5-tricarboxylate decarboxylase/2-hydroxyhepta-2,4-diene-1,7-dioate isomerase